MAMQRVTGSRGSSVLLAPDLAARVRYVVRYLEDRGHELLLTEGYRPTGIPSDRYVTDASKTSTGGSNQWYQVGRMDRGLTPSAIIPNSNGSNLSRHSTGMAIDWNAPTAEAMRVRAEAMGHVGLVANVASESWHAEPLGAVQVDLTPFRVESKPSPKAKALIKENPMFLANTKDTKRIYLITSQGVTWLRSLEAVTFFRRLIEWHGGNGAEQTFYQKEINVIEAGLKAATGNTSQTDPATLAKLIATQIRGDVTKAVEGLKINAGASAVEIAKVVSDEIAKRLAS